MVNLQNTADFLGIDVKTVENYTEVWKDLYDLENTNSLEYAEMIQDIVLCYE